MKGSIYVISGPSGVGKSTIIKSVRQRFPETGYSVSHTSRAPRPNEKAGVDYHFVDKHCFQEMIDNKAFVEWAPVYDHYYGTSRESLEKQTDQGLDVILDIDSQGARNIKRYFKNSILIFIMPPSLEELNQRLASRATDTDEVIKKRTALAELELKNCEWYDYIVINDNLERAISSVEAVILSDRCSNSRMFPEIKKMFNFNH